MILKICITLLGLSNICILIVINRILKQISRHESYILELCNILSGVFSKEEEDEDAETE